jgi:hypothetical protein
MIFSIPLWGVGVAFLAFAVYFFLTGVEDGGYLPSIKHGRMFFAGCSLLIGIVCIAVYFATATAT